MGTCVVYVDGVVAVVVAAAMVASSSTGMWSVVSVNIIYCLQDGPTPAAGAVVDGTTVERAAFQGLNANAFLANNDSFTFFSQIREGDWLLMPGLTGTNVMDIQVTLVDRQLK